MAAVEIAVRALLEAFKYPVGRPNGRLMESWTGPRMEQAAPFVNPTISIFGAADSDWNLFCLQRHLSEFFLFQKNVLLRGLVSWQMPNLRLVLQPLQWSHLSIR